MILILMSSSISLGWIPSPSKDSRNILKDKDKIKALIIQKLSPQPLLINVSKYWKSQNNYKKAMNGTVQTVKIIS